jgi:hypothetical protein
MATYRRRPACASLWVLLGLLAASPAARGSVITFEYGGVITSADPSIGFTPGERFSGTFSYDPSLPTPAISIEGSNQYFAGHSTTFADSTASDGAGLTFDVNGTPAYVHTGGVQVDVAQVQYSGQYGYQTGPYSTVGVTNEGVDGSNGVISLSFKNPSAAVLGSLALPTSLSLASLPVAQLVVTGNAGSPQSTQLLTGTIDSLAVVAEPASVAVWLGLVGVGAALAGYYRRAAR